MTEYYREALIDRAQHMDEFQLRLVLAFIDRLFGFDRPVTDNVVYLENKEVKAA